MPLTDLLSPLVDNRPAVQEILFSGFRQASAHSLPEARVGIALTWSIDVLPTVAALESLAAIDKLLRCIGSATGQYRGVRGHAVRSTVAVWFSRSPQHQTRGRLAAIY